MADKPPLLAEYRFGALHPANTYAKEAFRSIPQGRLCKLEIKGVSANEKRRSFYWVMLDIAAEALTDATGDIWDQELLHDELKRVLKLGDTYTTPSGREVFRPKSTKNRAMTEPERARWVDRCANVLSNWLQCEITILMDEARQRSGTLHNERKAA